MDLLSDLNPQQHQAVTATPGPTLVLAGPGSGKTRVLTHRVAYLVAQGTPPNRIMAVTFTNKAAHEMRGRIEGLLAGELRGLTIGTFHAICARILRREADRLPVTRDFVIYDSADQLALIKQALEYHRIDAQRFSPQRVHSTISNAKNELIGPEQFIADTYYKEVVSRVYERYQALLRENNALDFDDLLLDAVELFQRHPEVLAKYQRYYEHILVDEFQDTNMAQYALLRQLGARQRQLFVVGDPDQCFPPGTLIQTENGPAKIETLRVGDHVLAASGRGATMPARVNHVQRRRYGGQLIRVITRSGHSFRATPNHIVFARLGRSPGLHYVYLIQRRDKGCRIGISAHAGSDGISPEPQVGQKVRGAQEGADRIWVLRVCDSREDAYSWESFFAFQYGIPTTVFHVRGRRLRMPQEAVDRLYENIDTESNAKRLLADLNMDWRFPHYIPQGISRNVVNLRYFGDSRPSKQSPWNAHRIDLWSNEPSLRQQLDRLGYHPRDSGGRNWRLGFSQLHYHQAQALAQELSAAAGNTEIVTGAFLVSNDNSRAASRFSLMPVSHLHPSMVVAIVEDGQVIQDKIIEITREDYEGQVYDLEVDKLHNYVADGIVVHNSIYRWRGADYRNVRRFQDDYPDALTILLERNYRSTQIILDAAMAVIDQNLGRKPKQLFTERAGGERVYVYEAYDENEEAQFVVDTIATLTFQHDYDPADCAVMYRTNAQSRALEDAFIRASLPYRLVGATRFYARREVKDVLAFLRLVHNPYDTVSLFRILNVPPRGIGPKTLDLLRDVAADAAIAPVDVLRELGENGSASSYAQTLGTRAARPLGEFGQLLNGWLAERTERSVVQLLDLVLDSIDYHPYLDDGSEAGEERWNNVMELRSVASEFSAADLTTFLEEVSLVSEVDNLTEEGSVNAPTLLTLHAAKGLEFPVVFIVGLDDGILPHQRSFDEGEAMAEERRLFYVGMTRARDQLFLTHTFRRTAYGDGSPSQPSRFLADVPSHLLTGHVTRRQADRRGAYRRMTTWETTPRRPRREPAAASPTLQYRSGQRVAHAQFGEGLIVESRVIGGDEMVTVAFEDKGIKRLLAAVANLTVLDG